MNQSSASQGLADAKPEKVIDNAAGPFYKDVAIISFNPPEPHHHDHASEEQDLNRQSSNQNVQRKSVSFSRKEGSHGQPSFRPLNNFDVSQLSPGVQVVTRTGLGLIF